jgi:LL-diaminopimelate aminotransferase
METTSVQFKPSNRIAGFKPYFFTMLGQRINELKTKGMDVIRMDMGSPDLPPADFIVDALYASAKKPDAHGYMPYAGTMKFRSAVAEYYQKRFQVTLDPATEVLTLIGSKEGLFNLSQVLLNPGDISLVSDPGYPVYFSSAEIAGAEVYSMPLLEKNHYLPDLNAIPSEILKRAKLLWINYPNNPTGAIAPDQFYLDLIQFAKRHGILIAHDAPYSDVCFDGYQAPSILQFPGAKEVAVEFNSLSKTYNMAGWRLGMVVGNPQIIRFLSIYKSQVDTSQFQAIMDAGCVALTGDQTWLEERNDIYQHRRDLVVMGFTQMGFHIDPPKAAIYVWVKLPEGTDSTAYCARLLDETGVSLTPGVVYGKYGEGYLRVSLATSTDRIQAAMSRVRDWIGKK